MAIEYDSMNLKDLIRLQEEIAQETRLRYERRLGLIFADLVGSTQYLEEFGNLAGRALLELFRDLVRGAVLPQEGRIIDFAGDGAFCIAPSAEQATQALISLQKEVERENLKRAPRQQISIRCGTHFGPVLVDGDVVSGDAVHLCSRIMSTADGGSIRLSEAAFNELKPDVKVRCRRLEPTWLKGIPHEVTILILDWRDRQLYPSAVRIVESGQVVPLPDKDRITMGRLAVHEGKTANDLVLMLQDIEATKTISRWHIELTRGATGYKLRALSDASTVVDGVPLKKGDEASIRAGSIAKLSGVITLVFHSSTTAESLESCNTIYNG